MMTRKNGLASAIAARILLGTILFAVSLGIPANGLAAASGASSGTEVKIDNFSFGPQTVTIPVGATVTWVNRDDIPHTVVNTEGVFNSKVKDTDEKFSYTFSKAGTYPYYCSVHPKMTGKIVVQ